METDAASCMRRGAGPQSPPNHSQRVVQAFMGPTHNLAHLLKDLSRDEQAMAAFQRLAAARPTDHEAVAGLAKAHVQLRQLDQAEAAAQRAVALAPDDRVGFALLVHTLMWQAGSPAKQDEAAALRDEAAGRGLLADSLQVRAASPT